MIINGLEKVSLSDYPGEVSAVLFTQGCNFNCIYCYNPELISTAQLGAIDSHYEVAYTETEIIEFLESRREELTAVVITGGEPTLQPNLLEFVRTIKNMGYKIKVDTNGSNPEVLSDLIRSNNIDYIAMDIKTAFYHYPLATRTKVDITKIWHSIFLIMNSNIDYEFRTTVGIDWINKEDIENICMYIENAELYVLKNVVNTSETENKLIACAPEDLLEYQKIAEQYVKRCIINRY